MRLLKTFVAGALLLALPVLGQETYPGTEYISGKAGFNKKMKGTLIISEHELRFQDKKGQQIFTIPMDKVTRASNSKERDEGGFGRKMMLGLFSSKTEEFLEVESRSPQGAEAVVFKTKKKQSPGMATKINYYVSNPPKGRKKK